MRRRLLGSDSHRLLGLQSRRDLILVTAVDVQQVEAIRDRNARLLGRSDLLPHLRRWRWIGLCAFIHVKVDLLALVPPVALVSADRKKKKKDIRRPGVLTGDSSSTGVRRWHCEQSSG